jgi:heterodisulfide reductase subunit B
MNDYLLYPGCSMEHSARAYADSLNAICKPLDLHLTEIEDWNCCGATEYLGISLVPAYALIARNLAIAAGSGNGARRLVAPCSACYLNLAKADHHMSEQPSLGEAVNKALAAGQLSYTPGSVEVYHLLDVIMSDVGVEAVEKAVVQPLAGLRLAPYLGCMLPRPDYANRWADHDLPQELDQLLRSLGAEVVDFPLKTECCGGHMTQIGPEMGFELIRRLIDCADEHEADAIVTVCPMCQLNLDAYQGEMNQFFKTKYHMPVLFFTQLMGLALGVNAKDLGFGTELVSATNVLKAVGAEPPPEAPLAPPKRPRKPEGLPMPKPLPRRVRSEAIDQEVVE